MSSSSKLTRAFRSVSAIVYIMNIVAALMFMFKRVYLDIVVGGYTVAISLLMLMITIESPMTLMDRLQDSNNYDFLFTFKGRYILDIIASLFLFAMGFYGIICAGLTLGVVFGIRLVGVRHKASFDELFKPASAAADGTSSDADDEDIGYEKA